MPTDLISLEIPFHEPMAIFSQFQHEPLALFLDSSLPDKRQGRFSFIARDPFQVLSSYGENINLGTKSLIGNPFQILEEELKKCHMLAAPDLPPFQSGVAGYFGYELCHHLERLPRPRNESIPFPEMLVGFYDCILAFDNIEQRAWVLSSGYPETNRQSRAERARERAEYLIHLIANENPSSPTFSEVSPPSAASIQSNFSPEDYQHAVQEVIEYILAGDIFQANLSQRFHTTLPLDDSPFDLYCRLRKINPSPFGAYFNGGETTLACASPERFLRLHNRGVETRPIKGTRPRSPDPVKDQTQADALRNSEKDRSENIMIVDLLRNDLSRVCLPHTVMVPELCALESYASVHHLVSTVTGTLNPQSGPVDLLRATFPGGSITGAPKVRAMEIISELEPDPRGPYCGSLGYIGFNGDMDINILIRTFAIHNRQVYFQAGGGIVSDSNPAAEYIETMDKARLLFAALNMEAPLK